MTVRFLPGFSGTVTSGSSTSSSSVRCWSSPVRSYSRVLSQSSSCTTTSMRFCCRTERIPNNALVDQADAADLHEVPGNLVSPTDQHVVSAARDVDDVVRDEAMPALDQIEYA